MTDTITPEGFTPEEYRTAAKVLRDPAIAQGGDFFKASDMSDRCEQEADRLEAESARDEEVEKLAKAAWESLEGAAIGGRVPDWMPGFVRAVLDQLAADGRLLPEGGTVLTAEQWADVRIACGADDVKHTERVNAEARLRRLAYGEPPKGASEECWVNHGCDGTACDLMHPGTPPAAPVPDSGTALTYDEGTLHRVYAALGNAGLSRQVAEDAVNEMQNLGILFRERPSNESQNGLDFDISADRYCICSRPKQSDWVCCEKCLGAPPAVSAPDSGPDGTPEKPWPTWQDVPEGVTYTGACDPFPGGNGPWVNRGGARYMAGSGTESLLNDVRMAERAPFVRVDGDKA